MKRGSKASDHYSGIGQLSQRSGVAVPNIRYYEAIGILPKARRSPGDQRSYVDADLKQLIFVKNCRELGFPLEQVRALLHLSKAQNRTCNAARDLAAQQLDIVRRKIAELSVLETELKRALSR
jgi:MerR family transcriptional regulator, copper efflux regulator